MMIRARMKAHLSMLMTRFPKLQGCEVHESAEADYRYRIFVPKKVWAEVMAGLALDCDYDNFKSEVKRYQGERGDAYESALHRVWSVMYGLQSRGRRSGGQNELTF